MSTAHQVNEPGPSPKLPDEDNGKKDQDRETELLTDLLLRRAGMPPGFNLVRRRSSKIRMDGVVLRLRHCIEQRVDWWKEMAEPADGPDTTIHQTTVRDAVTIVAMDESRLGLWSRECGKWMVLFGWASASVLTWFIAPIVLSVQLSVWRYVAELGIAAAMVWALLWIASPVPMWGSMATALTAGAAIAAFEPPWPARLLDGVWRAGIRCGLLVLSVCAGSLVGLVLVQWLVFRKARKDLGSRRPSSYMIDDMIQLYGVSLGRTPAQPSRWEVSLESPWKGETTPSFDPLSRSERETNERMVNGLEQLARRFERDLSIVPRLDWTTEQWLIAECRMMASGIREWKRLVVLPGDGGNRALRQRLARGIAMVASGDWSSFKSGAQSPARRRPSFDLVLRQGLAAIVPLAVFTTLHLVHLNLPTSLDGALGTFAVAWLAVHVLRWLDPDAAASLSATQSLRGFLSTGQKQS